MLDKNMDWHTRKAQLKNSKTPCCKHFNGYEKLPTKQGLVATSAQNMKGFNLIKESQTDFIDCYLTFTLHAV